MRLAWGIYFHISSGPNRLLGYAIASIISRIYKRTLVTLYVSQQESVDLFLHPLPQLSDLASGVSYFSIKPSSSSCCTYQHASLIFVVRVNASLRHRHNPQRLLAE